MANKNREQRIQKLKDLGYPFELKGKVFVVDENTRKVIGEYDTVKQAEQFIAQLELIIPDDVHAGRFGIDPPEGWSKGREDYEADVAKTPLYHDGTKRKTWEQLSDVEKWSWNRPKKEN